MIAMDKRKQHGVVYTPRWVVDLILDKVGYRRGLREKRLIDPACGDGAFLCAAAERFLRDVKGKNHLRSEVKKWLFSQIVGFDIDQAALNSCADNLDSVARQFGITGARWNLQKIDSTNKNALADDFGQFDFVVGNPPYVRIQHLGENRREKIRREWQLCCAGSTDIYIAFFELGCLLLKKRGRLGYITPNTYLKTRAGFDLREFLRNNDLLKLLIDFGHHQVFGEVTTYTLITILEKGRAQSAGRTFSLFKGNATGEISPLGEVATQTLSPSNWILASSNDLAKLNRMKKNKVRLGDIAQIHVGVTTLADGCYIFRSPQFNGKSAVIRMKNGCEYSVEKSILRPIVKASVLRGGDEVQNRHIIFPYRRTNGKHALIPETDLRRDYPLTYRYFLAIKEILDRRDKGKPNPVAWYAFGRSQGLDTSFGKKILTSPMGLSPNFLIWKDERSTFYSGYCIKFNGDLNWLAAQLNSPEMSFYIDHVSRKYQSEYKSFAKSFIADFYVPPPSGGDAPYLLDAACNRSRQARAA